MNRSLMSHEDIRTLKDEAIKHRGWKRYDALEELKEILAFSPIERSALPYASLTMRIIEDEMNRIEKYTEERDPLEEYDMERLLQ